VGTVESFTEEFEAIGGEVLERVEYAPEQTRYTGEVREITSEPVDFIFNSTYVPELSIMLKASAATGTNPNWVAPGWAVNDSLINAVGELAEGVWAVDSAPNVEGEAYKNFTTAFAQNTGDTLAPSDTYVFSAYDMPIVLGLAMTACECSDGREMTDAIRDVTTPGGTEVSSYAEGVKALKAGEDIDYQGASSDLDFDQVPAFGLYRVESGEVKLQEKFEITN
jgi:branched-chain amino acid transport system substrate-binding protein